MAQIETRISSKVDKETGRAEVLLRFFNGKVFDLYSGSDLFIKPEHFEYYVDRAKTEKKGISVNAKVTTMTKDEADAKGYCLRKSGIIVIRERIETADVTHDKEQCAKLDKLKAHIIEQYTSKGKSMTKDWLKDVVERYNHPEKFGVLEVKRSFAELAEEYYTIPHGGRLTPLSNDQQRAYKVLVRAVSRYEGYVQFSANKLFSFDIDTITRADIAGFADYLKNEKSLSERYPSLFKKLMEKYPLAIGEGHSVLQGRGENTVKNMLDRLKSLFRYFVEMGYTTNRPFEGYKIGAERYGAPVYISIDERNQIADADLSTAWETMDKDEKKKVRMPLKTLLEQRDIFVFQCFVGCRVSDLVMLTDKNINNGILSYTPRKTKDSGEEQVQPRIPLHDKALALINKYKGVDSKGRLFPFICARLYNDAIKVIFKMAGITRMVEVRNPLTGNNEFVPINTIASSHLARRTFVGNLYFKVQDPNLIGKMSGHVEGSEAFKRYRKIEDSTLKDLISNLD